MHIYHVDTYTYTTYKDKSNFNKERHCSLDTWVAAMCEVVGTAGRSGVEELAGAHSPWALCAMSSLVCHVLSC